MNQSIFGFGKAAAQPPPRTPPADAARVAPPQAAPSWSMSADTALLAILESPLRDHETAAIGFARKEAELRHIIASLTVAECRALHMRLWIAKAGDPVASAFQRFTGERRARVLHFIADARRREALRQDGK